ncbi:acetoacetate decarboxylase family protein [Nannocystis pusilla]|uniref:acetoacetate decarboxylase family protein n=1 Tax=Nannocystis pusilla TaxID=889268 RepID=UPI003B78E07D
MRSIRGSTFHRLDAGASGYDNLVLCGDWTMNPMNLGCVEGATMSGIRAAQVISGEAIALHDDWLAARRPALRPLARERPRYIQRALNESTSPPYEARATAMYAAVLAADPERLAELCERHLGLNPERCYLPLGPSVVFYAQHNHALSAVDAPGVVPERDFGFLVPVAVCERRAGKLTPVGVAVYMPYLWVDLGAALLGGREVLGFPKGQATLCFPAAPTGAVELRVDTWMPPAAGRSGAWREERLIDARLDGSARSRVRSLADALRSGFDPAWLASRGVDLAGQLRLLRALTLTLRTGGLRMVFLKQYRDAAACDRACYQAIVEAPAPAPAPRGWPHSCPERCSSGSCAAPACSASSACAPRAATPSAPAYPPWRPSTPSWTSRSAPPTWCGPHDMARMACPQRHALLDIPLRHVLRAIYARTGSAARRAAPAAARSGAPARGAAAARRTPRSGSPARRRPAA